jgi:hypothetical protein
MMNESVSSVRMLADEALRFTPASDSLRATIDAWCSSSKGLLRGDELTWDRGGEAEYLEGLKDVEIGILFELFDDPELNLLADCSKLCI